MKKVTIAINEALMPELTVAFESLNEKAEIVKMLQASKDEVITEMVDDYQKQQQMQIPYLLGLLKANLDILPSEYADQQIVDCIPLDYYIKMIVNERVLCKRERMKTVCEMTLETEYWRKYRRLSETICGYGYNMYFIEDRFKRFYPEGLHEFVTAFAKGYSAAFHTAAKRVGIETVVTDPVTQDIWKNWPFFLEYGTRKYRLDGKYMYMYHGGYNCTGDDTIPFGSNTKIINEHVYTMLKGGPVVEKQFELNF